MNPQEYKERASEILWEALDFSDVDTYQEVLEQALPRLEEATQQILHLIEKAKVEARIDELNKLVLDGGIWHGDVGRSFPQKIRHEDRLAELKLRLDKLL
jgi:hypothetical protein